ncbi:hypothetical protein BsWGS_23156 [Bradybaena similaris]
MAGEGDTKEPQPHVNHGFSGDLEDQKTSIQPDATTRDDDDDDDDEEVDLRFGLGPLKSARVGKYLSNLYVFAFFVGNAALLPAGAIKSISINLKYLKTQFNLGDEEAADMQMANSIGIVVASIITGYIGSFHKADIPILVGITAFLNGIALMAPSFLQFAHPYHINVDPTTANLIFKPFLCMDTQMTPGSSQMMSSPNATTPMMTLPPDTTGYAVLVFSQAMSGFLLPMAMVLGPIYIDNNEVNKAKVAVYMGLYTLFAESASISGLSVSGFLAINPVDFRDTKLNPQDSRFVGAWWLPLLLFGACLCVTGVYIAHFPKRLISKRKQRRALAEAAIAYAAKKAEFIERLRHKHELKNSTDEKKDKVTPKFTPLYTDVKATTEKPTITDSSQSSVSTGTASVNDRRPSIADSIVYDSAALPRQGYVDGVRDFPMQIYRILKNPVFTLIMIDAALLAIPLKGSELFRPLYQIFEFSLSPTDIAAASMGSAVANIIGVIIGAGICWKTQSLKGYALTIFTSYVLCSLIAPIYFALGCDNQDLYGYGGNQGILLPNVTNECRCSPMLALPTCGDDGRSYYSPCFAGCHDGDGFTFQNCSRLSTPDHGFGAKSMMCDAGCFSEFIGYTVILSLLTLLTQMAVVPRVLLIIRMVEPRDRASGISVFIFFFALFSIPASKLFGHVFDDVGCQVYMGDVCVLYDRTKIRYLMSGIELSVYVILLFTTWIMFLTFKMMERKVTWKMEDVKRHGSSEPITKL